MTPEQRHAPGLSSPLIQQPADDFHLPEVRSSGWLRWRPIDSPQLSVRSYRAGDDARLVALWNHSYAGYAGLAQRTVEYWRWTVLERPGMSQQDVLLVESAQGLLGYAALWTGGKVLELAVDPQLSPSTRRDVTRRLLSVLEARVRDQQQDSIELMLPTCDRLLDLTLRSAGYGVDDGSATIVRLLNPEALLSTLTAARAARLMPLRGWKLLMTLGAGDDPFLLQHRLYVQFDDSIGVRTVGEHETPDADAGVQLTLAALAELVFCGASVRRLLETGDLRIEPQAAATRVVCLLDALAVEAPWYTPCSEMF
jgi:hypothetical protein